MKLRASAKRWGAEGRGEIPWQPLPPLLFLHAPAAFFIRVLDLPASGLENGKET